MSERMTPCERCQGPPTSPRHLYCDECRIAVGRESGRRHAAKARAANPTCCQRCLGPRAYGNTRYCESCSALVKNERLAVYAGRKHKQCERCGAAKGKRRLRYCDQCVIVAAAERRTRWAAHVRANPELYLPHLSARRARLADNFVEAISPLVVLERDDGVCGICREDVDPFDFHVDHVIPLSQGGEHSYANVQAAHPACNMSKGARLPEEAF